MDAYADSFSPRRFASRLRAIARLAGRELVELALQLFYAVRSPTTPPWARAVIYGALGYLIAPLDSIPDFVPIAGYSDDMVVLAAAVTAVAMHITPAVKRQAQERLERLLSVA